MNWVFAIGLAVACFALAMFAFRLPRQSWTLVAAALLLGLAGYAFQQRGDIPAAPALAHSTDMGEAGWQLVELRRQLLSRDLHSRGSEIVTADAMFRQGRFANAVALLRGAVEANPGDHEAWLAMGNALVEHAGGRVTPAALYAYRRAAAIAPQEPGPSFFLGLNLVRQGELVEAHRLWSDALERAPDGAEWRPALAERVTALEELMRQIVDRSGADPAAGRDSPAPGEPAR